MSFEEKQEAAEQIKKKEGGAGEIPQAEKERGQGELSAEREHVAAELIKTETEAKGVDKALAEAEAFAAKESENLDPEAKAEFEAMKQEPSAVKEKFQALKAEAERINAELSVPAEGAAAEVASEVKPEAKAEEELKMTAEEANKYLRDVKKRDNFFKLKSGEERVSEKESDKMLSAFETIMIEDMLPGDKSLAAYAGEDKGHVTQRYEAVGILARDERSAEKMVRTYINYGALSLEEVENNFLNIKPGLKEDTQRLRNLAVTKMFGQIGEAGAMVNVLSSAEKPDLARRVAEKACEQFTEVGREIRNAMEYAERKMSYDQLKDLTGRLKRMDNIIETGADISGLIPEVKYIAKNSGNRDLQQTVINLEAKAEDFKSKRKKVE